MSKVRYIFSVVSKVHIPCITHFQHHFKFLQYYAHYATTVIAPCYKAVAIGLGKHRIVYKKYKLYRA